ncbi:hypothetical protein P7C71_g4959, partial [Lecanoromycetidae sp. Uapishka_2]
MFTSRQTLVFKSALFLLAFFSPCEALPASRTIPQIVARGSPNTIQGYVVPVSDGSTTSLPSPSGTLKAIGVGYGHQNYTCAAASTATPSPVPVSIGAKATLYNAATYLPSDYQQGLADLIAIIKDAVSTPPPNVNSFVVQEKLPVLGQHYFNGAGQPTFDLGSTGLLVAKKIGDILAPTGAPVGLDNNGNPGFGAIDWLTLTDAGGSQGLNEVYRVETGGGKPPSTCDGYVGEIDIPYAATYWFFD